MYSVSGMMDQGPSKYSMSVSMYRGGGRGYGRPESAPPDLPSLLLDARICYLGMPVSNYLYISLLSSISTRILYLSYHFPSV
jgi:ATP-dependent Clp protease protease subunit